MFEALESRQMFSTTMLPFGIVTVVGNDLPDEVVITQSGNTVTIRENWVSKSYRSSAISMILINGNGGRDLIRATADVKENLFINGGAGNDYIEGGSGNDVISGSAGQDIIYGRAGNDVLRGNEDVDYLDGGAGNDTLYGGDGNDSVYGGAGDDTLYGDAGSDNIDDLQGINTVDGGAGYDFGRLSFGSRMTSFEGRQ